MWNFKALGTREDFIKFHEKEQNKSYEGSGIRKISDFPTGSTKIRRQ